MTPVKRNGSRGTPLDENPGIAHAAVIVVVLAGGRSSRMGQDKALLPFRGAALIDHVLEQGAQAGARTGQPSATVISGTVKRPGIQSVPDLRPDRGPLEGIYSVLSWLIGRGISVEGKRLLVIPVDLPRVTAAVLLPLLARTEFALASHYEGQFLPMCFRLNSRSLGLITEMAAISCLPPKSIHEFLGRLESAAISVGPAGCGGLRDVDTAADWDELRERT
ncbi:MAG TPA: molybdenum cofactor guanylyltransferase [Bdellovibrionota bacterium]|nr:molybdenum cofactor guanylyltransferase [Bdellovibrionota bacterium]